MPELWTPAAGVNRKHRELIAPVSAVNRKLRELWARDSGGVNRKIFSGADITASIIQTTKTDNLCTFGSDGAVTFKVANNTSSNQTCSVTVRFAFSPLKSVIGGSTILLGGTFTKTGALYTEGAGSISVTDYDSAESVDTVGSGTLNGTSVSLKAISTIPCIHMDATFVCGLAPSGYFQISFAAGALTIADEVVTALNS